MATTEPCCGFPNSTHYAGCTCHENGWAMRLAAAEAERDRLQEKLDQFDAHGMPNVAAALDRIDAAESRALCLEGERDAWQQSAVLYTEARDEVAAERDAAEARLAEATRRMEAILDYEPKEVAKDEFAYDRMVESYRDVARAFIYPPTTEEKP